MRSFLKLAAFAGLTLTSAMPSRAAELVMVDSKACVYCQRFDREVGNTYAETPAGQQAPLRKVSRSGPWPSDLGRVTPAHYTPVFILVDKGQEIGRFPGFTGEENFWERLDPLLARLETAPPAKIPEVAPITIPELPATGGLW